MLILVKISSIQQPARPAILRLSTSVRSYVLLFYMPQAQGEESEVKHDCVFLWGSLLKVVENSSTNRVRVVFTLPKT